VEVKPDHAQALLSLGALLVEVNKDYDWAITCFRRSRTIIPKDARAHYNLGFALTRSGRLADALAPLQEAIKLNPAQPNAHFTLGAALFKQGRPDEAIAAYREAIRLKPDHFAAHNILGRAFEQKGRLDEAIAAYREAVRLNVKDVLPHTNLGNALRAKGQWAEAWGAYGEALKYGPNDSWANNCVARFLAICPEAKFRDAPRAVRLAQQATRLKPKEGDFCNTLGVAHYRADQWAEAVTALDQAAQLRRGGTAADWFFLAMAHSQLGNADKSEKYFHQAVRSMEKHQPKNEELRRFRAEAAALLGIADDS
jgi:superkiller protein 3